MEVVYFVEKKDASEAKDILLKDDEVSRQSVIFRDAGTINYEKKEGTYIKISGNEDAVKKAAELLKELAKEVSGKEKETVIKKIKDEEDSAAEGFGSIFG